MSVSCSQFPVLFNRKAKPETENDSQHRETVRRPALRGQLSMELMIIIGFIVLIFIPLIVFVYYKSAAINSDVDGLQAHLLSTKLAYAANSLGSMGSGSALKMEFSLPATISTLEFRRVGDGGEVIITKPDGSQISQVSRFPFASMKNYSGGSNYKLELYSDNGTIYVRPSN